MKKFISIILVAALMLCLCACGNTQKEEAPESNLKIVCTAFPQYDFVKTILGTDDGLTLLTDDGGDLHSFEPTAQDIITIGSADLFIYIGGTSDEWVEGVIASANNPDLKTIALMELVETYDEEYVAGMERDHDDNHSVKDEHVWLSLGNAGEMMQKICDIICEIDPDNSAKYISNAGKFIADSITLDMEYRLALDDAKRNVLLFADRFPFRYLTEAYNLEYYAAFAGCSSESEASFQTIAFLIDKTKELSLPVVLTIDGSDGSIAKTICESTGAKTAMLDSCQSVSMADIENGTTYLGIMRSNLEVLREALS